MKGRNARFSISYFYKVYIKRRPELRRDAFFIRIALLLLCFVDRHIV